MSDPRRAMAKEALQGLRSSALRAGSGRGDPTALMISIGLAEPEAEHEAMEPPAVEMAEEGSEGMPIDEPKPVPDAGKFRFTGRREGGLVPPEQRQNDGTPIEEDEGPMPPQRPRGYRF